MGLDLNRSASRGVVCLSGEDEPVAMNATPVPSEGSFLDFERPKAQDHSMSTLRLIHYLPIFDQVTLRVDSGHPAG